MAGDGFEPGSRPTRPPLGDDEGVAEEPEGGAVCWLDRVCQHCGGLEDGPPGPVCPRCGTARSAED